MDKQTVDLIKTALNQKIEMYKQRGQLDISVAYQVALELIIYAENGETEKIQNIIIN